MALVNKNQDVVKHSSSYMLGNSVRVHVNPILENTVVDGRLASDLEFALQTKDPAYIGSINPRATQYGNSGSRHVSASDAAEALGIANDAVADFENSINQNNVVDKNSNDSSGSGEVSTNI